VVNICDYSHNDLILKELEQDPVALEITSNQDTPYLHEAMLTQYVAQIREAMKKEEKSDVPSSSTILLSVWSAKCNSQTKTREVCKPEARLNLWVPKHEIGLGPICWW
jgi:hypothetical protein